MRVQAIPAQSPGCSDRIKQRRMSVTEPVPIDRPQSLLFSELFASWFELAIEQIAATEGPNVPNRLRRQTAPSFGHQEILNGIPRNEPKLHVSKCRVEVGVNHG